MSKNEMNEERLKEVLEYILSERNNCKVKVTIIKQNDNNKPLNEEIKSQAFWLVLGFVVEVLYIYKTIDFNGNKVMWFIYNEFIF